MGEHDFLLGFRKILEILGNILNRYLKFSKQMIYNWNIPNFRNFY